MNSKDDIELGDDSAAAVPAFFTRKSNDADRDLEVGAPAADTYKAPTTTSTYYISTLARFAELKLSIDRVIDRTFGTIIHSIKTKYEDLKQRRAEARERQERRMLVRKQQRLATKRREDMDVEGGEGAGGLYGDGSGGVLGASGPHATARRKKLILAGPNSAGKGFMTEEELEAELASRRAARTREREKYLKAMQQEKMEKLETQLSSLKKQLGALQLPADIGGNSGKAAAPATKTL